MSIFNNQLRSVIEWKDPGADVLFEKWTSSSDEIKNASKLIVNPGQGCLFVYEGKVQSMFIDAGLYDLKTANIPFWTTITKFMQGFQSEHKVGLYFFKTTQLLDIKWGTSSPIKYEDPKYKFPVGLRAFGNFSMQIAEAKWFFINVMGTRDVLKTADVRDVIAARIVQPMTDYLASAKFTYTEIDAHRTEIATNLAAKSKDDFEKLGFRLFDFRVEGTSFDDETMKRINRIADMTAEAQAAGAAGLSYTQLQQLEALKDAAKNPGGAGMMMGVGVGMGFGGQVGAMAATPVGGGDDPAQRLLKLKSLLDQGLITAEEFAAKKKDILDKV